MLVALPAAAAQAQAVAATESPFVPNLAAMQGVMNVLIDNTTSGSYDAATSRLAYETSDTDVLLDRLSTFFPPGQFFGNSTFELGNTTYRIIGADVSNKSKRNVMGQTFLEAMYESFNQEYQTFHLLTGFSEPVAARSAPRKNVTASDPTKSLAEAAAAQERWSELVTDEFNLHQQYDAVDITVTAIAGSDLAATLPTSWVPMSKNSPAFEAAMRQRGFKITCVTVAAYVSEFAAQKIFNPNNPGDFFVPEQANSTAIEMKLTLTGRDLIPLDIPRQTLLLYSFQVLLPRLFNGIGPRWTRITDIRQAPAANCANLTILFSTSSQPQYFEQAMITALADLPLQLAIAGLPANLTVYSARAVPGYTLVSQVNAYLGMAEKFPKFRTGVFTPSSRPHTAVSRLNWQGGKVERGQSIPIGIVRHRVVGSPTASSDVDLAAEIENAFQILNKAKPWNFSLSVSGILPPLPAPSASSTLDPVSGNRKLLQAPTPAVDSAYQFDPYNDFSASDFSVQYNATVDTLIPVSLVPLALPLYLAGGVMRARGLQVTFLTIAASLNQLAAPLLAQMQPLTDQTNVTAIKTNFQLTKLEGQRGSSVLPFELDIQSGLLAMLRGVLPPLSNNLGPRWVRIDNYAAGPTGSNKVNVTMVMVMAIPVDEFTKLLEGALNELPLQLGLSGLPVGPPLINYMGPVTGYTLESQLRAMLGQPLIQYPPLPPVAGESSGGGTGTLSAGAIAGIAIGTFAAAVAVIALVLMVLSRRRRRHQRWLSDMEMLDRPSGTSLPNPLMKGLHRQDDSAEKMMYRGGNYSGNNTTSSIASQPFPPEQSPGGTFRLPGMGSNRDVNKSVIGSLDATVQGWDIAAESIEICRNPDGDPWLLGEGSYGRVYRGVRGGVQDVAVKVLHASDDSQTKAFQKEISILKSISYDRNIVQFYGAVLTDRPMLVLEYMEGGDLRAALNDDPHGHLRWYNHGQHIALDIARGLHFLHSHDVMHSDMKARNVLLSKNREVAKISDVGVAKYLNDCATATQSNYVAWTFAYAAPEILLNQRSGSEADVYSFGVMLWEIVTTIAPVRGGMTEVSAPQDCPQTIADLIQACLSVDPSQRPTAKRAFQIIRASIDGSDVDAIPAANFASSAIGGSTTSPSTATTAATHPTNRSGGTGSGAAEDTLAAVAAQLEEAEGPAPAAPDGTAAAETARRASINSTGSARTSRLRLASGVSSEGPSGRPSGDGAS